jgi:hypothetical protein
MRRGGLSTIAAALAMAAAGCGASTVANGQMRARAGRAISPVSPGSVDPAAVPLGDGYVGSAPRVGYVDSCISHFGEGGGAQVEGPWIDAAAKTWDSQSKIAVGGSVRWPSASYRVTVAHGRRVIAFNDLPIDHTTGAFPISSTDPAYRYDHNPNRIAAQRLRWSLPLHPSAARRPACTPGGPIGVLRDGVVLYNALDGEGRDAGAHEVLDRCGGHPDQSGTYHHHMVPSCIFAGAPAGRSTLVGYALDGYGIYVQKDRHGELPSNTQLDACHGTVSRVRWNGRMTRIYHYVATLEYPYAVGCFHGTPIRSGHEGAGAQPGGGGAPGRGGPPGPGSGGPPGPP